MDTPAVNEIPIFVNINPDGESRFVELKFEDTQDPMHSNHIIRLYINTNPSIPHGKILYDYFGDGEMYFNPTPGIMLKSAKDTLHVLYKTYFLCETSNFKIPPTSPDIKIGSLATSYLSPNSDPNVLPFYGWLFETDLLFNTEPGFKSNITFAQDFDDQNANMQEQQSDAISVLADIFQDNPHFAASTKKWKIGWSNPDLSIEIEQKLITEAIKHPVCKHYSYINNDFEIISKEYKFANHISGFPTCSNPQITKSDKVTPCGWAPQEQLSCIVYGSSEETITKVSISPKNTSQSFNVELSHYITSQNKKFFRIINKTTNQLVNTIFVPEEISFQDALKEANSVFDEYISHYVDHNDTNNVSSETVSQKEIKSFIGTLISINED